MKHDVLRSIGHNIADSLAGGCGLMVGMYEIDVYGEAASSEAGILSVDFLTGETSGVATSAYLKEAARRYSESLPSLCERSGARSTDFKRLVAYYEAAPLRSYVVELEDNPGRVSRDRYVGWPGAQAKGLDALGRVRPARLLRKGRRGVTVSRT